MKFAKELEQDLVPEWRAKYLDYKTGKKKIKAVARALKNVNQTPKTPGRQKPSNLFASTSYQSPHPRRASTQGLFSLTSSGQDGSESPSPASTDGPPYHGQSPPRKAGKGDIENRNPMLDQGTSPMAIKRGSSIHRENDESEALWDSGAVTNYGSILSSPPNSRLLHQPPSLELPDPAMSPNEEAFPRHNRAWRRSRLNPNITPLNKPAEGPTGDAFHVGKTRSPTKTQHSALVPRHRHIFAKTRSMSTPGVPVSPSKPPLLRRLFSNAPIGSPTFGDVPMEAYKDFDLRQAEFLNFLDKQLEKIETFYKMKEMEAVERLSVLKQQLHEMRDRRVAEVEAAQRAKEQARQDRERLGSKYSENINAEGDRVGSTSSALKWIQPIENAMGFGNHFGKNTKAMKQMASPGLQHTLSHDQVDFRKDFTRRPTNYDDVPYRSAKRKLKLAMLEYYRGLELLKSYALLNRTAFRKINKKYDKACQARPTGRYMSEKVNKAWFVQSEVLEAHIVAVEDLYARYFERGHHKVAVGKLRSKTTKNNDYTGSVFRNGLLLAGGLVFGIEGLVYGGEHLAHPDLAVRTEASYLLQIYGGYFLALLLFLLFCVDCWVWTKAKINYVFIFEFDTRHNLDWHQLSELPCLLFFLLGLFLWLNFQQTGADAMYLYWPVALIILTIIILLFPGPILYHRSRHWWAYSNFRLLLAGIYPVEFRDFFLGDMYCSQTYSMGNIELFFCLYAHHWSQPTQCNSTHSRLLGFFSCLPGIWRALQCLRRYYDTRNAFPHLVNCGKYTFTILSYMTLSLYRISESAQLRALFILTASINAIYCSIWDLAMDWSLGNPYAEHPYLRDVLGYKRPGVYYAAMVLDPILRFNWIFYALFRAEMQHSALLSFALSLAEVLRRAVWTLFRVENEHCTNVGRFRASRDVPLPYDLLPLTSSEQDQQQQQNLQAVAEEEAGPPQHTATTGADLENTPSPGALRRRQTMDSGTPMQRGIARVGTIMNEAHVQDFERRRRPEARMGESFKYEGEAAAVGVEVQSSDESDEEEEVVEEEEGGVDGEVEMRGGGGGGGS
ncbi:MAG: hypothetical protein Q9195_006048 [Heterodermia aff. obscurata]